MRQMPSKLGGFALSIHAKICFTYNDTAVTIELSADSLSALDSLKWLVNRVAGWIDDEKHVEECSEQ
jgi:hypothetical protein